MACGLVSSGKPYRGYGYRVKGDLLIVAIKSGLVNSVYHSGDFRIEIVDNLITVIQYIAIHSEKCRTALLKVWNP